MNRRQATSSTGLSAGHSLIPPCEQIGSQVAQLPGCSGWMAGATAK